MRRAATALLDLGCGIAFVLLALFCARVLLQSRALVYLCFPLFCSAALVVGFWRSRTTHIPLTALLVSIPLFAFTSQFLSGRNRPFIVFPILLLLFVTAGAALGRIRPKTVAMLGALAVTNAAAIFAGPLFVGYLVRGQMAKEKPVPFVLRLVNGQTISSQQLRGRIVVLDFRATWCVPCQHELPIVQRAYQKTVGAGDVAFFAVDGVMTDAPGDSGDTAERALAYFRRGGYTMPLVWDGGATLERAFSLKGFPTLLVLDREGRVRMRHVGFIGSENLEETLLREIDELRAEAPGAT